MYLVVVFKTITFCYNIDEQILFAHVMRKPDVGEKILNARPMIDKEQITTMGDEMLVRAPAKINLSLLIAGKRPDGFHEIETIMAKVNFYDEILIEPGQKHGIEFVCAGPCESPAGKENLVYRAAEMILDNCGCQADIKLTLTKHIPAGSGLGSASSDAAATLIGLNKYLDFELSNSQLADTSVQLGSDVPFFFDGPLALCSGRGEKIKKLDENFNFRALLILPDVSVSTKEVYANYRHDIGLYERLSSLINGFVEKNRIDLVVQMCANMLEKGCFCLHKELAEFKTKIEFLGIRPVCLSGSGSSMFYIAGGQDKKKVEEYQHKLTDKTSCKSVIVSNNRW